jgi:Zn-dependent oligopeptidase
MSGSYQAVDDFLTNLQTKLEVAGKEDYNALLQLKEEHCKESGVDFDGVLNAWDTGFYGNRLLKTTYGVDAEAIREYFPLDHVVATTLDIYQELLGLTFEELVKGTYWSWHTEVRCFQVKDTNSGKSIGHFYLDLHPREGKIQYDVAAAFDEVQVVSHLMLFTGKYGHAAIFHLVKHNTTHGAVDCMLCNLPASTAEKPSLLRHQNVVTFFHEFGPLCMVCAQKGSATARGLPSAHVTSSRRHPKCSRIGFGKSRCLSV